MPTSPRHFLNRLANIGCGDMALLGAHDYLVEQLRAAHNSIICTTRFIIKCYLIGKNTSFFQKEIKNKITFSIVNKLEKALIEIFKDIKILNTKNNIILLSPAAASFDQFKNFENRGNEFKKLSKYYARKII